MEYGLKFQEGKRFPYRLARLNDCGKDLSKRWCVEFYAWDEKEDALKRKQIRVSSSKYITARERRAFADAVIKQVNTMLVNGAFWPKENSKKELTLQMAVDSFLEYKKNSIRSAKYYRMILNIMSQSIGANKKMNEVNTAEAYKFLDQLQAQKGWSNKTRNQYRGVCNIFFNHYIDKGILIKSPWQKVKIEKEVKTSAYTVMQPEELQTISDIAKRENYQLYVFLMMIFYTFGRPKELLKLRLADVNLTEKKLRFRAEIAKNKKTMHVAMNNSIVKILENSGYLNQHPSDFLFGAKGSPSAAPAPYLNLYLRFKKVRELARFPETYKMYAFKHTGVCRLYEKTKDIDLCRRQCRHSNIRITQIYLQDLGLLTDTNMVDF